jgi:HAD superfamily hydrolase (TIGR01484 family)
MLKYRLLAIDLDGTLLSKSKKISANNFIALHRYISNGGSCVIMTGRSITSAERYAKQIDDYTQNKSKFIIALNGAYVKNLSTGESIKNPIDENIAKDIYAYAKKNKLSTWFYTEESIAKKGVISTWSFLAIILKYLQCIRLFRFKKGVNLASFKLNILSFSKKKLERTYK